MKPKVVPVKGFEDLYTLSEDGKVFSVKANRYISGSILSGHYNAGYVNYILYDNRGLRHWKSLRHLLAEHFLPEYEEGMMVSIIDPDKPLTSHNIQIRKDKYGNICYEKVKIQCQETGKVYPTYSSLSRELYGTPKYKSSISVGIRTKGRYKGKHYTIIRNTDR